MRHFAFLRGINVGGHRVKMDELRAHFEAMGFDDVATFIASGNVIFSSGEPASTELERRIEAHLLGGLGYEVATFVRSLTELEAAAVFPPAVEAEADGRRCHVIFLPSPPDRALREAFEALATPSDTFHLQGREIYWLLQGRLTDSPLFGKELDRATGDLPTTMRNMNTIRRLVAKYGGRE